MRLMHPDEERHLARPPKDRALAPAVADGFGVASALLGLFWFGGIGSVLAIIFGIISRRTAKRAHRKTSYATITGLVLGWIGLAGAVIVWLLLIALAGTPGHS
jgi:hypothetical protein